MNKWNPILIISIVMVLLLAADDALGQNETQGKTTICHVTGNHPATITVSDAALEAHLAHGDTIGQCIDDTTLALNQTAPADFAVAGRISLSSPYPNPSAGIATVTVTSPKETGAVVGIFDLSGRRVQSFQSDLLEGRTDILFDMYTLPAGVYMLLVSSDAGSGTVIVTKY